MDKGASTSLKSSLFREVLKTRYSSSCTKSPSSLEAYIVEKSKQTPHLEMVDLVIVGIHNAYSSRGLICKFNGFWKKIA